MLIQNTLHFDKWICNRKFLKNLDYIKTIELTRNQKIWFGFGAAGVLLVIETAVIYFVFIQKDTPKPATTKPPSPITTPSSTTTTTQSSHGVTSGCHEGTIGVYAHTLATPMAGAWVYGFKPASSSVKCTDRNVGECILPFSTKNNKWSRN